MLNKFFSTMLVAVIFFFPETLCRANTKTILRTEDPVIIKGKKLRDYLGIDPSCLGLSTYQHGKFRPIPFQIDEATADGQYVLGQGKAIDSESDPKFDENDELVFMINDLGDKAPFSAKPENADQCRIIEVTDPVNNKKGWAYLCTYKNNPPKSEMDYVDLVLENNRMDYTLKNTNGDASIIFSQAADAIVPDTMQRYLPGGKLEDDLLDRMKFRVKIKLKLFPDVKLALDGRVHADLEGWVDGPVRVITASKTQVKLGFIKLGINARYQVIMYRNGIHATVEMISTGKSRLSSDSFILKNSSVNAYMDFTDIMLNHYVYSENNPCSIKAMLDGKTTPNETQLDVHTTVNWIAGYGEKGGIMARILVPEEWDHIKRTLYLHENLKKSAKPEEQKGELGVGWKISQVDTISSNKGRLVLFIYYFEPGFKPPMEKDILNIHDHPVVVDVITL